MKQICTLAMGVLATLALTMSTAWAGSPHFVTCGPVSVNGACVTVSGKEAGLGDEDQINVVLSATAQCINPGNHHPQAGNKADIAAGTDVPVQNGKANYMVTGCAEFQPDCTPPMTVVLTDILITDTTNNITCTP
jgi:hypothetical protein